MTDVTFGGTSFTPFQSSAGTVSEAIGVPSGRTMANGSQAVVITRLLAYIGGYGGSARSVTVSFAGSSVTNTFAASSNPGGTWLSSSNALATPGTYTFSYSGGPMYGKRGADGSGGSATGTFGNWASYWAGGYSYVQAAAPPTGVSATSAAAGSLTVSWTASTDDGGSSITSSRLEYDTNPGFTSGTFATITSGLTRTITGLTPGATYYVRIASKNAVSDAAGTYGPYSTVASAQVLTGAKYATSTSVLKNTSFYLEVNGVLRPCAIYYATDSTHLHGLQSF